MSGNGTNVGAIYYTTTLETQGLVDANRKVDRELKKAGDAGDALQTRFKAVAAGIAAALAAIGVEKLARELVAAQREFDVLFSSLKTAVGGSMEVAAQQFQRLQKFAAETPYTLEQSVRGFTQLVNLGIDPSERAMRSFSDTAAAMGKDLSQMIEAVADASTNEFERLKAFGIKAKDEGSKVALTFRGVKTEVQKNAAAITEYLVKLGETNFAGASAERMKTLDGAISNLGDSWKALLLTVSQSGFGDAVAAGAKMATDAIGQAEASIKRGQLTEYFDALRPVLAATEVAVVSLAGSMAGQLVTSVTASTSALVTKTLAARAAAAQAVVAAEAELAAATAAQAEAAAQYGLTASLAQVAAASARTAAAQEAMAVAQANAARQAIVGSVAGGVFRGVIGALGGPIGIAITALTLLALNWDKVSGAAKSAAEISEQAAGRIRAALSDTGGQPMKVLQDQASEAAAELAKVDEQLKALRTGEDGQKITPFEQDLLDRREALRGVVNDTAKAIDDLKKLQVKRLFPDEGPTAPKVKQEPDKSVLAKAQEAKAYYEQMAAANAQGLAKINAEEQQALADNKKRMIEDKDNAATYQRARTEIVARFARERKLLEEQNTRARNEAEIAAVYDTETQITMIRDETLRQAQRDYELGVKTFQEAEAAKTKAIYDAVEQRKQLQLQRQQTQLTTLQIKAETTGNPETQAKLIQAQAQAQVDAANEAAQRDLANWQLYADQKVAITERMNMQLMELQTATETAQYAMAQSAAGQMLDVLRRAGKERTAMGKALFLAERALAVATIILNTELGAAKAVGIAGPFGIPLATLIRATGYASAGMVAGLAVADAFGGGRQYGGPVDAGSMYRVNETGRPEMFTASNGAQYMLPTRGGSITPADQVGGGSIQWTFIVQNNVPGASVAPPSVDTQARTVTLAVNEVASQLRSNTGPVSSALRSNWDARPKL